MITRERRGGPSKTIMSSLSEGPPLAEPSAGGPPVHATLVDALKHVAATNSSQGIAYVEPGQKTVRESYGELLASAR